MIAGLRLWQYRIPLRRPLQLPGVILHDREGLLLEWEVQDGSSLWSETSPLPGFSSHSLESCQRQWETLLAAPGSLRERLQESTAGLAPEVRFGIEAGLLQIDTRLPPARALPTCRLLPRDSEPAGGARAPCIKLKLGIGPVEQDIARVRQACALLEPQGRLRLDANQGWTLDKARMLAAQVDPGRIEFIEEPLPPGSDYSGWMADTGLPLAFDESLRMLPPEGISRLLETPGLAALVLKPMLLGLEETTRLVGQCRARDIRPVLSAAYESNISLDLYARLADAWGFTGPQGLDTFDSFTASLIQPLASQPAHGHLPVLDRSAMRMLGYWT